MSWEAPFTFLANEALDADDLTAMLRDNMNETATANAANTSSYFVSDAANSLAERKLLTTSIGGSVSVTSTSFVDENGPTLDVTHGGTVFVIWGARIWMESGSGTPSCSMAVDGQVSSSIDWALRNGGNTTDLQRATSCHLFTGLTPGTDTLKMQYLTNSGTASFGQRQIIAWPF